MSGRRNRRGPVGPPDLFAGFVTCVLAGERWREDRVGLTAWQRGWFGFETKVDRRAG